MALATRCPHCRTTFRVAHDQLKLRAGLVRCGACKEIFNGVEHLLKPDEAPGTDLVIKPPVGQPMQRMAPPALSAKPPPDPAGLEKTSVSASASSPADPPVALPGPPAASTAPASAPSVPTSSSSAGNPSEPDKHFPGKEPEKESGASESIRAGAIQGPAAAERISPANPAAAPFSGEASGGRDGNADAVDPLQRMTLMDFTAFDEDPAQTGLHHPGLIRASASIAATDDGMDTRARANPGTGDDPVDDTKDELSQAIEDLQRKPWRRTKKKNLLGSAKGEPGLKKKDAAEPAFVRRARLQKKYGRIMRAGTAAACIALLAALSLQGLYAFRNSIAANMPESRALLSEFCGLFGCTVEFPAQIGKVSIETSELHSLPANPDQFILTVLLNNQAATAQAWPDIELTLNDANERPVARKVFTPRDYLGAKESTAGFPPESERSVKISFELLQLKASGYRVYLFYP